MYGSVMLAGPLWKWGFPQCIGAIDGSHIPIIAPSENALDSVKLQALVDHEYRFLDVYVGGLAECMMYKC